MKRKTNSKRKLAPRKLSPECLCCGGADPWVAVTLIQQASFRGQLHEVSAEVTQCRYCEAVVTTPEQDEALLHKTRQAHWDWIKLSLLATQKRLKLPQREFAAALSISTATLSRALKAESPTDPSTEALILFKMKELRAAQEKKELLALALKETFSHLENSEQPWDPSSDAADSSEVALAA